MRLTESQNGVGIHKALFGTTAEHSSIETAMSTLGHILSRIQM